MTWTVDYGSGPQPVTLPHSWHGERPVHWEGPAIYRTTIESVVPDEWLVFHGSSYATVVEIDGVVVADHQGIWDAFAVRLPDTGKALDVVVTVVNNGGETWPVKNVLSGFLPYVYHTFGGLYRGVSRRVSPSDPTLPKPASKPTVTVNGGRLTVDGRPFFVRGALTWGWYPETADCHPSPDRIELDLAHMAEMGFNLVKFCLWLPPHEMLGALEKYGLYAWIELPLWMPGEHMDMDAVEAEVERIVGQYRHHPRIIAWTVGCELESLDEAVRERLVEKVIELTGCPLVMDNSGGSEMYAPVVADFGTFADYHPYCDTEFYRPVLESLQNGCRPSHPILLGEFNDFDRTRNLAQMKTDAPYWASADPDLNDKGVRWQHDFPALIEGIEAQHPTETYERWHRFSVSKAHWIRRRVHETVRSLSDFSGYVLTGWADTPISTSGMVDEQGDPVFGPQHWGFWNQPEQFFLLPDRKPPWIEGGNRPGWRDTQCQFSDAAQIAVGIHSEQGLTGTPRWKVEGGAEGEWPSVTVDPLTPTLLGRCRWSGKAGKHLLTVELDGHDSSWPVWLVDRLTHVDARIVDPRQLLGSLEGSPDSGTVLYIGPVNGLHAAVDGSQSFLAFLTDGDVAAPFWRECIADTAAPESFPFFNRWEILFSVSDSRFFSPEYLAPLGDFVPLIERIDTRTYERSTILTDGEIDGSHGTVTMLRPHGGRGSQGASWDFNPAGHFIVRSLIERLNQR